MIPSPEQTYEAVVQGMNSAHCDLTQFGRSMLLGGKTKGIIGREPWLCKWIKDALEMKGFGAKTEAFDRIDISIVNPQNGCLECVIEAKFLYCHDCYKRGPGHYFLKNISEDIEKRSSRYSVPHQAIVLVGDYQSMCPDGKHLGLYHADAINSHLAKHDSLRQSGELDCCGFIRFEKDLFETFESTCDIFPRRGQYSPNHTWEARYEGASELIRAWVLGVRSTSQHPVSPAL
jgi:hypothetical protein